MGRRSTLSRAGGSRCHHSSVHEPGSYTAPTHHPAVLLVRSLTRDPASCAGCGEAASPAWLQCRARSLHHPGAEPGSAGGTGLLFPSLAVRGRAGASWWQVLFCPPSPQALPAHSCPGLWAWPELCSLLHIVS